MTDSAKYRDTSIKQPKTETNSLKNSTADSLQELTILEITAFIQLEALNIHMHT